MRQFVIILLVFWLPIMVEAQSFSILDAPNKAFGSIESEIRASFKIKNKSNQPLYLGVKLVNKDLASDEQLFFCWSKDCNNPSPSAKIDQKISAGAIWEGFTTVLKTGRTEQQSQAKLVFFNVFDTSDTVSVQIQYLSGSKGSSSFLFSTPDLMVSNLYPNPATNQVSLDYALSDEKIKVNILIQNVLGGIVEEYQLSTTENKLKINTTDLKPGVYFYTLLVDNKSIVTKKIIIKK